MVDIFFHIDVLNKGLNLLIMGLNKFFDLIVLAKNSGHYSEREIHFFYDIWDATRLKQLKSYSILKALYLNVYCANFVQMVKRKRG